MADIVERFNRRKIRVYLHTEALEVRLSFRLQFFEIHFNEASTSVRMAKILTGRYGSVAVIVAETRRPAAFGQKQPFG